MTNTQFHWNELKALIDDAYSSIASGKLEEAKDRLTQASNRAHAMAVRDRCSAEPKDNHPCAHPGCTALIGAAVYCSEHEPSGEPDLATDVDGPYCDEHLNDVRAWCVECINCTAERRTAVRTSDE